MNSTIENRSLYCFKIRITSTSIENLRCRINPFIFQWTQVSVTALSTPHMSLIWQKLDINVDTKCFFYFFVLNLITHISVTWLTTPGHNKLPNSFLSCLVHELITKRSSVFGLKFLLNAINWTIFMTLVNDILYILRSPVVGYLLFYRRPI